MEKPAWRLTQDIDIEIQAQGTRNGPPRLPSAAEQGAVDKVRIRRLQRFSFILEPLTSHLHAINGGLTRCRQCMEPEQTRVRSRYSCHLWRHWTLDELPAPTDCHEIAPRDNGRYLYDSSCTDTTRAPRYGVADWKISRGTLHRSRSHGTIHVSCWAWSSHSTCALHS